MADGLTQGQRRTDLFKVVLDEWLKKDQAKKKRPSGEGLVSRLLPALKMAMIANR